MAPMMMGIGTVRAPSVAAGGVTIDAVGTKTYTAPGLSATYTGITVGSGSNRALAVLISFGQTGGASPTVQSVIWDVAGANQAMTLVADSRPPGLNANSAQVWGLVNPASGNKTVTMTWVGTNETFVAAVSFTGVDQTGGVTSFPGAQTTIIGVDAPRPSVTVTSSSGQYVVSSADTTAAISGITGTTIYSDAVSGAVINAFANYDVGAASVVIGQVNNSISQAACAVKAV